ncbi:MAG: hypothetical protein HYW27_02915 [Candidatus Aenigmarchaeota archaeon]|nr:hypothetical protein [Candidatus Aenigmarchaeota archaeon]
MGELEDSIRKMDFRAVVFTAIITALSFVVGLFWRDAISETINAVIPEGEGLFYRYFAAMVATVIVVIIAFFLIRAQNVDIEKAVKKLGEIERMNEKKRKKAVKKILSYKI